MKPGKILSMFFAIAIAVTSLAMISTNLHAETGEGAFTITLAADKTSASQGDVITYTYTLSNGTSENITGIAVNDSKFGAISLPATTLNVSENMTATFAYTVVESDLPGPLVNTATAQGTNGVSENITATSNQVSITLTTIDNKPKTKAEILSSRGVHGKGLATAPGLQKYFNSNSQAADNAGKKAKENNGKQNGKNKGQDNDDEAND